VSEFISRDFFHFLAGRKEQQLMEWKWEQLVEKDTVFGSCSIPFGSWICLYVNPKGSLARISSHKGILLKKRVF